MCEARFLSRWLDGEPSELNNFKMLILNRCNNDAALTWHYQSSFMPHGPCLKTVLGLTSVNSFELHYQSLRHRAAWLLLIVNRKVMETHGFLESFLIAQTSTSKVCTSARTDILDNAARVENALH